MPMEKRVTDLEVRYMRLERLVEELSSVVAQQQRAIERLEGAVKLHAERLTGEPDTEKPPHY